MKAKKQFKDDEPFVAEKKSMGETEKGKKLQITRDSWGNWGVSFESGGELPPCLSGKFTDQLKAEIAINSYIEQKLSASRPS